MLRLYFHPFSSFCQKVLIALYERAIPFEPQLVDLGDPGQRAALAALWPISKFPVLRDEAAQTTVAEASLIVEYLDRFGDAPPLVPTGLDEALDVRLWDRVFDLYVQLPLQKVVGDSFRREGGHDPHGVEEAKAALRQSYRMIDDSLARRGAQWICGDSFTLADCAAAPALFYANIIVPFAGHDHLAAYFERLSARPGFSRAVDEARPYRNFFPLPWPNRDQ